MVRDPRKKRLERAKKHQEQQKGPSMAQKAVNFAKASAKHVSSGLKSVSEETKNIRLAICNTCPHKVGEENNPTCNKCGCFLNIKTGWASQACPIGKWGTGEKTAAKKTKPSGGCGCGKKKT